MRGVKSNHLHLVQRLGMRGVVPISHPPALMVWTDSILSQFTDTSPRHCSANNLPNLFIQKIKFACFFILSVSREIEMIQGYHDVEYYDSFPGM